MDVRTAFPSKWLKAADLQGKKVAVTISRYDMVDVGDESGEDKPVIYFDGKSKGLILNITNTNMIAEICNDSFESEDWEGTTIVLYSTKVDFKGRRVDAIRIDSPKGKPKDGNKKAANPDADGFKDDDIPPF